MRFSFIATSFFLSLAAGRPIYDSTARDKFTVLNSNGTSGDNDAFLVANTTSGILNTTVALPEVQLPEGMKMVVVYDKNATVGSDGNAVVAKIVMDPEAASKYNETVAGLQHAINEGSLAPSGVVVAAGSKDNSTDAHVVGFNQNGTIASSILTLPNAHLPEGVDLFVAYNSNSTNTEVVDGKNVTVVGKIVVSPIKVSQINSTVTAVKEGLENATIPDIGPVATGSALNVTLPSISPEASDVPEVIPVPEIVPVPEDNGDDSDSGSNLDDFNQAILEDHNRDRAIHGASKLVWDESLAASAQSAADMCVFDHNGSPNGQNIFWSSVVVPGSSVTPPWYDEVALYSYSNPGYSPATGHFTQLVWASTTKIGCGRQTCGAGSASPGFLVFCEYSVAGNVLGQFEENVLPPV